MPSPPHKKHRKAAHQRYADQRYLNPAACFGLTVIEKPQFAPKMPVGRPFPPQQQSREPQGKQSGDKEQTEFRVGLRPLEKRFNLAVHSFVCAGIFHIHVANRFPTAKIALFIHSLTALCCKTASKTPTLCLKIANFVD